MVLLILCCPHELIEERDMLCRSLICHIFSLWVKSGGIVCWKVFCLSDETRGMRRLFFHDECIVYSPDQLLRGWGVVCE